MEGEGEANLQNELSLGRLQAESVAAGAAAVSKPPEFEDAASIDNVYQLLPAEPTARLGDGDQ